VEDGDIEEAASFAIAQQDPTVAPSTKRKYLAIENEYTTVMKSCPWQKHCSDPIRAGPTLEDMKFYIRIICRRAQREKTNIRLRTVSVKAWLVLALVHAPLIV
jgi:hypothetical protein